MYCCGPVPVKAIKEGELLLKYDVPFVFAEVNADVITMMQKKDGSTSKVNTTAFVGQKISTKSVGSDAREDITHLYKHPEGRKTKTKQKTKTLWKLQIVTLCLQALRKSARSSRRPTIKTSCSSSSSNTRACKSQSSWEKI